MAFITKNKAPKSRKIATISDVQRHKVYSSARWQRLRSAYLSLHPVCEDCESKGITTPAEDVHHRRSFMAAADGVELAALAYNPDNLMALCKTCHATRHNKERAK